MGVGILRAMMLLIVMFITTMALADGMYVGKSQSVKPLIPDQRAILLWHEGIETLIVESKLRAELGDYSWVIPLPSPPIEVAKARPSVMDLSFDRFDPVVARTNRHTRTFARWTLAVVCFFALVSFGVRRETSRVVQVLILVVGSAVTLSVLPSFVTTAAASRQTESGATAASAEGVQVLSRKTVGSYVVSVIRSEQASALTDWLANEGTPLPEGAAPIVKDYIAGGWCFVAAKLRKAEAEDLMPHPMRVRFKTDTPIYPMRLTGLVSDSLDLDLLVIGQQEATYPSLNLWRSMPVTYSPEPMPDDAVIYGLQSDVAEIRHVDLAPLLPPDAAGTRLRRTLKSSDMAADFELAWQPLSDPQPTFHTETGFRVLRERRGFEVLTVLTFFGALLSILGRWKGVTAHAIGWLGLVGLSIAVAYGSTLNVPIIELEQGRSERHHPHIQFTEITESIENAIEQSRPPGFDPFPVRFENALAWRRTGQMAPVDPRPSDYAMVREWNRDEPMGYQIRELGEHEYEVQIMNAWGEIILHRIQDRPPGKDDPAVQTTIQIVPWPPNTFQTAKDAGIVPNWHLQAAQFTRSDGKVFEAMHIGDRKFRALLPAGVYTVSVPLGRTLPSGELTWEGRRTLTVPFQGKFEVDGRLDLSKHLETLGR